MQCNRIRTHRRATRVGAFEVFEAAHVALRTLLAFSQPVNCIFWPIGMLNWLVAASKLHKHRVTCCTAEWPFYVFLFYGNVGSTWEKFTLYFYALKIAWRKHFWGLLWEQIRRLYLSWDINYSLSFLNNHKLIINITSQCRGVAILQIEVTLMTLMTVYSYYFCSTALIGCSTLEKLSRGLIEDLWRVKLYHVDYEHA